MRMADRYIINKCLNGDSTAFGMLVDKYKESVYALAYSKLRNFHDAEDVTQEAFMKAYQNLRTLRQWDDFHAWIYAITNNICKMMIRSRSRQPDCEFIEDQTVKSLHIKESYHDDPMLELLHEALDSLPEIYQQVLTLHYLGGMDGTEIAEFLGMSPTSIWQRLSRARSLLRKEMLDMMSETFEQNRLKAGFTFRIVEMVKRVRINPVTPKALPWGLSLATGIIIAVLSIGTHLSIINPTGSISGSPLPGESKVLKVGEYPVDVIKVSNISVLSNQQWKGTGLGSVVPSLQNALFMAPQDEGGAWTKKSDIAVARESLATSEVNGKIYAIGGIKPNVGFFSTVEEYDPATDKWIMKTDMPTRRGSLCTCVVNDKIYAIGGCRWENEQATSLSIVEEYDPANDKWIKKADMPTPRQLHLSASAVNGKIYAIGGLDAPTFTTFAVVEEYDPSADTWRRRADMPTNRHSFCASALNDRIYAIGGTNGNNYLSIVEEYDPITDKWTRKADMPTPRGWFASAVLNGKIYTIGGWNRTLGGELSIVEEYDPMKDKWTKMADMPSQRSDLSASVANGRIYAIGGDNAPDGAVNAVSTVEEYDPGTGKSINFKGKLPTTWGDVKLARNK